MCGRVKVKDKKEESREIRMKGGRASAADPRSGGRRAKTSAGRAGPCGVALTQPQIRPTPGERLLICGLRASHHARLTHLDAKRDHQQTPETKQFEGYKGEGRGEGVVSRGRDQTGSREREKQSGHSSRQVHQLPSPWVLVDMKSANGMGKRGGLA